jgi:hypothetical protein
MFNKPTSATEAGLLNKSSCLAPALGGTKLIFDIDFWSLFVVLLKSALDVQQTLLCFFANIFIFQLDHT